MRIIPVFPEDLEDGALRDQTTNRHHDGMGTQPASRRTFGYRGPTRRTFGWRGPSRRTFGRWSGSRRTFGHRGP